jgi:hypothetical protein
LRIAGRKAVASGGFGAIAHDAEQAERVARIAARARFAQDRHDPRNARRRQARPDADMRELVARLLHPHFRHPRHRSEPFDEDLAAPFEPPIAFAALPEQLDDLVAQREPPHADLVAAMLTVVDEAVVEVVHDPGGGGDDRQPFVVHPVRRQRFCAFEDAPLQRHRRAGGEVAAEERIERRSFAHESAFPGRESECLEQAMPERLAGSVDQARVGEEEVEIGPRVERGEHAFDLRRLPDVILIGEEDDLAGRPRKAAREVRDDADVAFVAQRDHRRARRCHPREVLDDAHAVIVRSVVDDHDLVGRDGLADDARQLFGQEPCPVVDAADDGGLHESDRSASAAPLAGWVAQRTPPDEPGTGER